VFELFFSITILEPFCLELHIYRDRQRLRIASKKNAVLSTVARSQAFDRTVRFFGAMFG